MRPLLIFVCLALTACGVKGKPQPPFVPPTIGRGEPEFSQATRDLDLKKKKPKKIEGDWDEPKDFKESKDEAEQ